MEKQVACGKVTFFLGMTGVCQADYLTSADQVIPDWLVLRFHFWESETN